MADRFVNLFEPDTLLPAQYFAAFAREGGLVRERRLTAQGFLVFVQIARFLFLQYLARNRVAIDPVGEFGNGRVRGDREAVHGLRFIGPGINEYLVDLSDNVAVLDDNIDLVIADIQRTGLSLRYQQPGSIGRSRAKQDQDDRDGTDRASAPHDYLPIKQRSKLNQKNSRFIKRRLILYMVIERCSNNGTVWPREAISDRT